METEFKTPEEDASERPEYEPPHDKFPLRKRSQKPWIVLLALLLVLLLGFAGWWYWKHHRPVSIPVVTTPVTPPTTTTPAAGCATGLTSYTNTSLGIGFCYPAAWGAVAVHDAKFAAADAGTRWRLGFSAKPDVNIGMASTTWTTAVARDGVCVDPGSPTPEPLPTTLNTAWVTEGSPVVSAARGIDLSVGTRYIYEYTDDVLTNGVCMRGVALMTNPPYNNVIATYSVEFGGAVTTPTMHMASPTTLISNANRTDFNAFVTSIYKL